MTTFDQFLHCYDVIFFSCSSFTLVSANLNKITVIFLVKVDVCSIFIVKFQNENKYLRHILLLIYSKICYHYCHFFLNCTIPISIFKWNKTIQISKQKAKFIGYYEIKKNAVIMRENFTFVLQILKFFNSDLWFEIMLLIYFYFYLLYLFKRV